MEATTSRTGSTASRPRKPSSCASTATASPTSSNTRNRLYVSPPSVEEKANGEKVAKQLVDLVWKHPELGLKEIRFTPVRFALTFVNAPHSILGSALRSFLP